MRRMDKYKDEMPSIEKRTTGVWQLNKSLILLLPRYYLGFIMSIFSYLFVVYCYVLCYNHIRK